MSDDIVIPRSELEGQLPHRWSNLDEANARGERFACGVPDSQTLAEWHYEKALRALAAAAEMKRLGF